MSFKKISPEVGDVALVVLLGLKRRIISIVNTHIAGDPKRSDLKFSEVSLIMKNITTVPCDGIVICGDFNSSPDTGL